MELRDGTTRSAVSEVAHFLSLSVSLSPRPNEKESVCSLISCCVALIRTMVDGTFFCFCI